MAHVGGHSRRSDRSNSLLKNLEIESFGILVGGF
jgi:hypothetical protein